MGLWTKRARCVWLTLLVAAVALPGVAMTQDSPAATDSRGKKTTQDWIFQAE
jgi:hypothetical protein